MKAALAVIAGVVVIGLIIFVGYVGGFWLNENSQRRNLNIQQHLQNKQTQIQRSSYNYQSATNEQVENLITSIDGINTQLTYPGAPVSDLKSQRIALTTQACQLADQLTGAFTTPDVTAFMQKNCTTP